MVCASFTRHSRIIHASFTHHPRIIINHVHVYDVPLPVMSGTFDRGSHARAPSSTANDMPIVRPLMPIECQWNARLPRPDPNGRAPGGRALAQGILRHPEQGILNNAS